MKTAIAWKNWIGRAGATYMALLTFSMVCGCAQTTYPYEVQIVNRTSTIISAGLVMPGDEAVPGFIGPDQVALAAPDQMHKKWGAPITPQPPFDVAIVRGEGPFATGPVLRVYSAYKSVGELVGYVNGDSGRADAPCPSGRHAFVVTSANGRLTATPIAWQNIEASDTLPIPPPATLPSSR